MVFDMLDSNDDWAFSSIAEAVSIEKEESMQMIFGFHSIALNFIEGCP